MRLRDVITSALFVAAASAHFALQWYGWKLHIGEIPSAPHLFASSESLWDVCSFPLFAIVSRRVQNLHFIELLLANSAIWGGVLSWLAYGIARIGGRVGRSRPAVAAAKVVGSATGRTGADRLVELKRMLDQGLISGDEYQRKRAAILTDL
jgi:hypothetical protein